jgi:large subunit ribosomal protein L24
MMNTEIGKISLRKDDQVQVIAGREKGKVGKIVKIDAKSGKVTVEKVIMVKKHMKPSQKTPHGGILEKESPLHYSNILLMCSKCNRGVRHGIKMMEKPSEKKGGKKTANATEKSRQVKVRFCKKCGETLDLA